MKTSVYIEVEGEDMGRPGDRPPKTSWKIELIKKGLRALQHASPKKSAEIIWHYFTMPGKTKFSEPQKELLEKAQIIETTYRGHQIKAYRWGTHGPKVLLCHGWRSKAADFRRMINALLKAGYVVEGIDMKAHGNSSGRHTALPEFRDVIKDHLVKHGPYDVVIGYSLGAIASGIVLSEVSPALHPKHYIVLAGPPYVRYFFKDIVNEVGCNDAVFKHMCSLVNEHYHQPIDYFDLRNKTEELKNIKTHLVYCEDDQTIPFSKGQELESAWQYASFVHAKGLGHYKIIANEKIIEFIVRSITKK